MKHIVTPALLFALLVLPSGCVEKRALVDGLATFQIEVAGDVGTADAPLAFPLQPYPVDLTVRAISNHGVPMTDFSGEVSLFSTPGHTQTDIGQLRVRVTLEQGVGTTHVDLSQVYGPTHVCAKDDLRHDESSYAVGCSPTIFFQMPTVAEVETTTDGATSPLVNNFLQISRGDLIVTGIGAEGFFVSDIAEGPTQYAGNWASLYVYNYSYPDGLQVGDHLESITGTVQEFTGATQLTFPSWVRREGPTRLEDVPAPVVITTAICGEPASGNNALLCGYDTTNLDLESLEGALVKVASIRTPSKWVDCDLNQDGNVPNYDSSCGAPGGESNDCKEIACKDACNMDPTCSELSSYRTYGQWAVAMNDGVGPKINLLTREGYPEFDPTKAENFGKALDVTGNLRQSLPARPRWIVVVRTPEDVIVRK